MIAFFAFNSGSEVHQYMALSGSGPPGQALAIPADDAIKTSATIGA